MGHHCVHPVTPRMGPCSPRGGTPQTDILSLLIIFSPIILPGIFIRYALLASIYSTALILGSHVSTAVWTHSSALLMVHILQAAFILPTCNGKVQEEVLPPSKISSHFSTLAFPNPASLCLPRTLSDCFIFSGRIMY